jgi:glucokinase
MYLGIEIGGTKLQLGLGEGNGTLAGLWRSTVDVRAGADGIRRRIIDGVSELLHQSNLERSQVAGVGIGFGGPVDDTTATVIKSHQIQGWDSFPLAAWIGDMLGWPAVLGNDADVAGLAEALFGAGKGLSPIFYITIGSGIGGGLIINGEIYRGCGRGAAEIGHLRVTPLTPPRLPERFLPLEKVASGWAIEKHAREMLAAGGGDFMAELAQSKGRHLTAREVGLAVAKGDIAAGYMLHESWDALAEAIGHVIALLCPRRIIIGGGVSLMGEDVLFKRVRSSVAEIVFPPFANCCDIVPAALGEEVVVHGALALAQKHLGVKR